MRRFLVVRTGALGDIVHGLPVAAALKRAYPNVRVEVAEVDPMVIDVAREFFAVPVDRRLRIATMDGRMYLQRARNAYGAIVVDAYGSGPYGPFIPYHLATAEFFQLAWQRLVNGGCLVYNVMGRYGGENEETVRNVQVTLESVFSVGYAFQARTSWNTVFVAQKIDFAALYPDGTRDGQPWPAGPWLQHPLDSLRFRELASGLAAQGFFVWPTFDQRLAQFSPAQRAGRTGLVLTDNYAPVDLSPAGR